jgi:hypothetical protein
MSILLKDLDYMLCSTLENKDLLSFCKTNKYYYEIYKSDKLWKMKIYLEFHMDKYIKEYINDHIKEYIKQNENLKNYYFELYHSITDPDFVKIIYNAINNKRCDIISVIFRKRNLDPNYSFCLGFYEGEKILKKRYFSPISNKDKIWVYSPLDIISRHGTYLIWNFFKSLEYPIDITYSIVINAIYGNNEEIFKDISLMYNVFTSSILYFSIRKNNIKSTQLILNGIDKEIIEELLNKMAFDFNLEYRNWIKEFNESLSLFLSHQKVSSFIPRFRIIGINNKYFIEFIDHYSRIKSSNLGKSLIIDCSFN